MPPQSTGFPYFERQELNAYALALHEYGFRFNFHVVGDGAVRTALDVIETVKARFSDAIDRSTARPTTISSTRPIFLASPRSA